MPRRQGCVASLAWFAGASGHLTVSAFRPKGSGAAILHGTFELQLFRPASVRGMSIAQLAGWLQIHKVPAASSLRQVSVQNRVPEK